MNLLGLSPVIPVVVLDDPATAVPLARALLAGGIGVIEVTLRTPTALESVSNLAQEVPEIVVGAGTVTTPRQAEAAADAGAAFLVTPGVTTSLLDAAISTGLRILPGCATISEALALRERGFTDLKFFPAEAAGGAAYLSAISGPLPELRFCPTGGVSMSNVADYLSLSNVGCVGGTWITPADAIRDQDWAGITATARATVTAHQQCVDDGVR